MKRVRVLFGVTSAMTLGFYRGAFADLSNAGLEVTVVSSPGQELAVVEAEGARVFAVPIKREIAPSRDLLALWRIWRLIRRLRPSITDFGTPKVGLLGGIASLLAGVPCRVYTVHGLRLETADGWKRRLLTITERIACACAGRVICVSPSLRDRVCSLGLAPASKTVVLARGTCSGIDLERFTAAGSQGERARLRAALGIPEDAPVIGFVGRFTRDKGISELLEAYTRIASVYPAIHLLMVGDFETGDPIDKTARDRIATDSHVIVTGVVPDVERYYPLMNVLALPTFREGFPYVPLEAQAAGIPVVTTDATGAIDSVESGLSGIIVPVGDVDALTNGLRQLLDDPILRRQMGQAGRHWVARNFTQSLVRAALQCQYRGLLSANSERKRTRKTQRWRFLSRLAKRALDVGASIAFLLLLSPVMLIVALSIRCTMGRPVLFRQTRPGLYGKPFMLQKFRTMNATTDAFGNLLPDSERLTRLGSLLRRLSLDELPQLWNVLRGDMSLVGPRPLLMEYLPRYTAEQARRHEVMPGITGWAQVNGRNALSWEEKLALDNWYVEHRGLGLDMKILAMTVWRVLRRDGISNGENATMPKFMGYGEHSARQVE